MEKWLPIGFDADKEKSRITFGLISAAMFSLLVFAYRLNAARDALYMYPAPNHIKTIISGARMADFGDVLGFSMAGFIILALSMIGLAVYHYNYHFQGSKSIYLMKRLPDRREFARRCFAVPAAVIVISLTSAFVLLVVYYWIYIAATPKPCLVPGQWQRFWNF